MKRITLSFLQVAIVLFGVLVLAFILYEPHLEGRNVDSTLFEIYFKDPFLAGAYAASTLFFASLYQAFKIVGYIRQNALFSSRSVKALRTIKYCMATLALLVLGAVTYLSVVERGKDDIAGGVAIGIVLIFIFTTVVASATLFEKHIQKSLQLPT
jgi:hypothetical protein